jgi:hypothetical protein
MKVDNWQISINHDEKRLYVNQMIKFHFMQKCPSVDLNVNNLVMVIIILS